jgi:hypothetical protein
VRPTDRERSSEVSLSHELKQARGRCLQVPLQATLVEFQLQFSGVAHCMPDHQTLNDIHILRILNYWEKNWFNIGFHKRTLFRGNITLPNKTSIHSSVLKRTRQLLQMPSFSKCQPETQSTLKSFTRAMHHLFRGQTTSSRTWTPSAHSLSLEVASDHHQEQLHCRSLTLTPCQSLWRGRRGHDVRAFGRRMRAELPLQTIKHSITLTFSSMHCAKLW